MAIPRFVALYTCFAELTTWISVKIIYAIHKKYVAAGLKFELRFVGFPNVDNWSQMFASVSGQVSNTVEWLKWW